MLLTSYFTLAIDLAAMPCYHDSPRNDDDTASDDEMVRWASLREQETSTFD